MLAAFRAEPLFRRLGAIRGGAVGVDEFGPRENFKRRGEALEFRKIAMNGPFTADGEIRRHLAERWTGSSHNCLSDAAIRPANSAAQGATK